MNTSISNKLQEIKQTFEKYLSKFKNNQSIDSQEHNEVKPKHSLPYVTAQYAFENIKLISSHYWQMWDQEAPDWAREWYGGPQPQYTAYAVADLVLKFLNVELSQAQIDTYRNTVRGYGEYTEASLAEAESWYKYQVKISILHSDHYELRVTKTHLGSRISAYMIFDNNLEITAYKLSEYSLVSATFEDWFLRDEEIDLDKNGSLTKIRKVRKESKIPLSYTYDVKELMRQMLEVPLTEPIDWTFLEDIL